MSDLDGGLYNVLLFPVTVDVLVEKVDSGRLNEKRVGSLEDRVSVSRSLRKQ